MVTAKELGRRTCPECGQDFTPHRPWAVFCTIRCRNQHHYNKRKVDLAEFKKWRAEKKETAQ